MALRDVNNFKFLSEAIIQRFRDPNLKSYKGILFEPQSNPHTIFGRVYSGFRELIGKGLNLHQYLNITDRSVLENLYRNLNSDVNLKFLANPEVALKDARFELPEEYWAEESAASSMQGEQALAPVPDSSASGLGSMPQAPAMPSIPSASRQVHVVQQAPPPTSGMEGGTGQGTAATAKIDRLQTGTAKATASAPQEKTPSGTPLVQRVNLQGFKVPPSLANTAKNFGSGMGVFFQRNIGKHLTGDRLMNFLGKAGNTGINALSGITNFGGGQGGMFSSLGRIARGGGGAGRFGGITGGGPGGFSIGKATKGRGGLIFALGLIGFMFLVGVLAITGTTPSSEATPLPGTADISSCKFLRSAETPPEASFKSSILLSYIKEASQKASIPAVVLAAFIRVESASTSYMSDDQIANYSKNCAESPTGALGIMQIQPPGTKSLSGDPASCDDCIDAGAKLVGKSVSTLTRDDYCDPRTSIIVGAGWILKKMSKLGYGDGTAWRPEWTTDKKAIEALVNTYYGCLKYGSADDTKTSCSDPGRIYSYSDDVWTSIQNCRVSDSPVPLPSGDLHQAIIDKFRINMDTSLSPQQLTWSWQILAQAETNTPKFFPLLNAKYSLIKVIVWGGMGQRIGDTIYLSNAPGTFFAAGGENEFKQILIHELGHIIHGERGDPTYTAQVENAVALDKDFLTGYAQGATANPTVVCNQADSGERAVQLDEDFAESIAYYINKNIPSELNYSNKCPPKNKQNPFKTGKYPNHLKLMQEVLGGSF